ncbi:TonB-dependent receptor [Ferruginibacter sp. SUN106]|uniref:TonB-dependent receptor n=1 Tax=Ferruginibacter sp. SUN106 TaxID=2978348 RepID=UPI003D36BE2E
MKRIFLSILLLTIFSIGSFAQKTLKGKVIEAATGNPLAGATITFAGKAITTSDKEGSFAIDCGKASNITVSHVGFEPRKVIITNCDDNITVSLMPGTSTLDEVEVTATSAQNKSILYQPASITKLSPVELKRSTGLFLDDAINGNVPGVTMQRRGVSSGQQFNIRGYGNGSRGTRGVSSNFDGQGYKVYLNGIPITDAEGITTMDDLDFGSIGNVEVTKGPAGTLYGLAIAGAVNLKTIKPATGKTSVGQDVLVGNYGLQRYTTHFATSGERSSLLLNYGHQKSDGFTIHNASHKDFVNFVGDFQPNAKQTITTYFGYSNSYDERSGELTVAQYDANDFSGNIEYIKRNGHSNVYTVRAGLGHTYTFNSHLANTTTIFATAFNSNVSSAGGWTDKAATNFGVRSTFDTKFSLKNNITLSGITGVETQRQNATTIGYGMIDPQGTAHVWKLGDPYFIIGSTAAGSNGITSDLYAAESTTSLFTEWTLALPKDFSVTAGLGLSNMVIKLDDRFYVANKPTHYDTTYKGLVSPHIALNKVFNKQFSAYVSYSRGYKAPVSSYFFIPYTAALGPNSGIINSHLEPEVGDQFEIGTKGNILKNKLTYQVALFNAVFSKKMTTVAVPNPANTATLYSYVVNGGKQDNKGIEALIKYTVYESSKGFFKTITPFANITYSDFKYKNYTFETGTTPANKTVVDYSGHAVAGVPKIIANLGFDIATQPGVYFNMSYFYKDKMPVTSLGTADGTVSTPLFNASSYSLLNAKLGYQKSLSKHFDMDLYFGVNNITGTKYPIMVFVNQIPDAFMVGPVKANSYGGVNVKYNF